MLFGDLFGKVFESERLYELLQDESYPWKFVRNWHSQSVYVPPFISRHSAGNQTWHSRDFLRKNLSGFLKLFFVKTSLKIGSFRISVADQSSSLPIPVNWINLWYLCDCHIIWFAIRLCFFSLWFYCLTKYSPFWILFEVR